MYIPIVNAWQLNERHYGGLQGACLFSSDILISQSNPQSNPQTISSLPAIVMYSSSSYIFMSSLSIPLIFPYNQVFSSKTLWINMAQNRSTYIPWQCILYSHYHCHSCTLAYTLSLSPPPPTLPLSGQHLATILRCTPTWSRHQFPSLAW